MVAVLWLSDQNFVASSERLLVVPEVSGRVSWCSHIGSIQKLKAVLSVVDRLQLLACVEDGVPVGHCTSVLCRV